MPPPNLNVFINCPFDDTYRPILEAIIFTVHDCGYVARSALELSDGSQVRIDKIYRLIADCRFGIHDLSYTSLDPASGLPRFNMPLELGIFLGAKRFGGPRFRAKRAIVLIKQAYQHQVYCSDISGQDVYPHGGAPEDAIRAVRNFLNTQSTRRVPGAAYITRRYQAFRQALPHLCSYFHQDEEDLAFNDLTTLVSEWLKTTAPAA